MKTKATIAIALLTSLYSFAQNSTTPDPPELINLREQNNRDLQRVSVPILQQYLLNLDHLEEQLTRDGRFDALAAVQTETQDVQKQIVDATNAADLTRPASTELAILSATYGVQPITVDVTKQLRMALNGAHPTTTLSNEAFGNVDPAPGSTKQTKIVYAINGTRKEKLFAEGHSLNFHDELQ
jgi:hypothetical protein